jgi:hypothetical protein
MMPLSRLGCREMEGNRSAKSSRPGGFGRMTRAQRACTPARCNPSNSCPCGARLGVERGRRRLTCLPSALPSAAVCGTGHGSPFLPVAPLRCALTMLLLLLLLPLLLLPLLHRAFCLSSALSRTRTRTSTRASGQPRPDFPTARTLAHSPSSHIRDRLTAHDSICAPPVGPGVACASPMSYCKHLH